MSCNWSIQPRSKRRPDAARCTSPRHGFDVRADRQTAAVEVPLADLTWRVRLPEGYEIARTAGTLTPDNLPQPQSAVANVAAAAYLLAGGVNPFYNNLGCGLSRTAVVEALHGDDESEFGADSEASRPRPSEELAMATRRAEPAGGEATDFGGRGGGTGYPLGRTYHGGLPGSSALPKLRCDRLEGVSSLNIQLQASPNDSRRASPGRAGGEIAFHSLGVRPELVLTVTDRSRLESLAAGLALAVGLIGLARPIARSA